MGFCDMGLSVPTTAGLPSRQGLSLSCPPAQGSPGKPSLREHGQVPCFFLPLPEPLPEPSLEHAFGGVSSRCAPAYPPSPNALGWGPNPSEEQLRGRGLGLSPSVTQQADLEAGFSLQTLPGGHQCLRTTVPRTSERPCTSKPWPCPPGSVSWQGSYLCAEKMTAAGWGLNWPQTER